MSGGRLALDRAGIPIANYFASEVDKYAIQTAKKNFVEIDQIGDVMDWRDWSLPKIDLLIGGSPCQGFSFAGRQLNFDDPRSKLFFEFADVLKEVKPKYFLLENVMMKKEFQDIISEYLGVGPIKINSSLVSAQNRERLYWTNIPDVKIPEDSGIILEDILLDDPKLISEVMHGIYDSTGVETASPDLDVVDRCFQTGVAREINGFDIIKRVYSVKGKAPTLTTMQGGHREPKIAIDDKRWRKIHPIEMERLQTIPDDYTAGVSKTQRHKMLGNGWTIDVIAHIFRHIPELR